MKKVFLSPSNQTDNAYAYGNTNEAIQCGKISEACQKALERSGVKVDVNHYGTLAEKCSASNKFGADLHVPIHTNAFNRNVTGTRIFCSTMSGSGYKAAKSIFDALAPITPGKSENVSANPELYEIRGVNAPSAYVECEFHDNLQSAKWIIEHVKEIGEAIAKGVCAYLGVKFVDEKSDMFYQVVTGSFKNKANAESRVKELKAKGFDSFIQIR